MASHDRTDLSALVEALQASLVEARAKSDRLEHALTEALERQAATGEILKVIAGAPADVQPVFEGIADSAMRLFGAWSVTVFRYESGLIRMVTARGGLPGSSEVFLAELGAPRPPSEDTPQGRAVLTRTVQHIVDVDTDPSWGPRIREQARLRGFRAVVVVPMLGAGAVAGLIGIARTQVGGFTPAELSLAQTFADQATIAIENARLLSELQTRNADLAEALEQQTSTSEILRVIASSPTDVQPVYEGIVHSAVRLCEGLFGALYRFDGEMISLVAHHNLRGDGLEALRRMFPSPATRETWVGLAILDRTVVHVADVMDNPEYRQAGETARAIGYRSALAVPMLREGTPIGVIRISRARATGVLREPDRAGEDLRRPGRHCHRERPPVQGAGGPQPGPDGRPRPSDRHRRDPSRDQPRPADVQPVFEAIADSSMRLLQAWAVSVWPSTRRTISSAWPRHGAARPGVSRPSSRRAASRTLRWRARSRVARC